MADDQKPLGDAEREAHSRLIADLAMEEAPAVAQPKVVLTAGQPGSGKSMIVNRVSVHFQGIKEPAIIVDPDAIRPTLPYMRERIASGDLNIPGAAFQDAGTIGARVVEMAAEGRRNIIYDGTLSNVKYARMSIENLKEQGYRVEIHGMAVSPDLSHASTYERREIQIKSSATGFGRGVGDDFHDQAVSGLVSTIGTLQAEGIVDAIVLYDRQGNVVGSTRMEAGQWVPDEQMAEALKNAHQNPNARTLRDTAASWETASSLMKDRGADPQEQQKVDSFRDAAVKRSPSSAESAVEFERACAEEGKRIVTRATSLDERLVDKWTALNKAHGEITAAKPGGPTWMPGHAAKEADWRSQWDASAKAISDNVARRDRIAPYTQTPIPGYPSKVEEAAVTKVQRRDPQLAKEGMAFRAAERQQRAQAMAESRTQQQSNNQKLAR